MHYRRIMAVAHLDPGDTAVLQRARREQQLHAAALCVIHVVEYTPGLGADQYPIITAEQVRAALTTSAQDQLTAQLARLDMPGVECRALMGQPHILIPRLAEEWRADLLIAAATLALPHRRTRPYDVLSVTTPGGGWLPRRWPWPELGGPRAAGSGG